VEHKVENYDDSCPPNVAECTKPLNIPEDIPGPVYVYYQLDNFYQNHRRYVKSRSFSQLNGKYLEKGDLKDCDPIILNKDLGPKIIFAAD
jgi:hypothetical protein